MNPYQKPESSLAEAQSQEAKVYWWRWQGRVGRAHYAIMNIFALLLCWLASYLLLVISELSLFLDIPNPIKLLAHLVLTIGATLGLQAWLAARRWNDLGCSSRFGLFSLIPFVNLILFLILLCLEGDAGENAYGAAPAPAPWWQLTLALLLGLPSLAMALFLILLEIK